MSDRPASGRRRSGWMKALSALGALVITLGLGFVVIDLIGRSALQTQLDAIRATGDPLTIQEIEARRTSIPDDRNGALVLSPILDQLQALPKNEIERLPLLGERDWPPFGQPLDRAMVDDVRAFLSARADLVTQLERMRDYPAGRFGLGSSVNLLNFSLGREYHSGLRKAVKVTALSATSAALEGRIDEAALDTLNLFNISATLADEETGISMGILAAFDGLAVRTLERTLSVGVCRDGVLARISAAAAERERFDTLLWAAWGERYVVMRFAEELRTGGRLPGWTGPPLDGPLPRLLPGWNRADEARMLSIMNQLVEVAKSPEAKWERAEALDGQVAAMPRLYVMTRHMLISWQHPVRMWVRRLAALRSVRAALAVERYRLVHGGWPDSLDVLVPDFPDAVPADPFDGQPLRYKRTDALITVYSIAEDKIDDAGDVERPEGKPAPDVGLRLLRPDLRVVRIRESAATQPADTGSSGQ
jgi:hypothetical protein